MELICNRGMKIGVMGFDLKAHTAVIVNEGNDLRSTTTFTTIGLAIKNAMLIPETANKYIFINSFTVSQNQVDLAFEKATGEQWDTTHVPAEEEKSVGLEKMSKGDFRGAMSLIRYLLALTGMVGIISSTRRVRISCVHYQKRPWMRL